MSIKYNYNQTGAERKALVEAISQILDQPARYLGAPSFSYAVGDYTVDRCGVLSHDGSIHPDLEAVLIEDLRIRGFVAENPVREDTLAENAAANTETGAECMPEETAEPVDEAAGATATGNAADGAALNDSDGDNTLTIEMPKAGFTDISLDNLQKIVASKESLLKKALGTDTVAIIDAGETLKFPWFTLHGLEGEADAYSRLVAAICSMAGKRKRVVAKERNTGNDKFTMRLFLVQLGFIGDEYKTARKILLRSLTGNSSWKSGHAPERPAPDTENAGSDLQPENIPAERATGTVPQPKEEGGEAYGK